MLLTKKPLATTCSITVPSSDAQHVTLPSGSGTPGSLNDPSPMSPARMRVFSNGSGRYGAPLPRVAPQPFLLAVVAGVVNVLADGAGVIVVLVVVFVVFVVLFCFVGSHGEEPKELTTQVRMTTNDDGRSGRLCS